MSAGSKPDRAAHKPFPADRITWPDTPVEAGTYDDRIPVENIFWHAGRKALVVRPAYDACDIKKVPCNRDRQQCEGCAADGAKCAWIDIQWATLPGLGGGEEPPVKEKRSYVRKNKAVPAEGDAP
ncbi:hypothetical protein AURDEDRAFT_165283 [Auricularia subglabra TFB-10046 SS5]|nr:hypothetical protein AURDEDRAFT_165283 [Auricularia subglabra TFB-10046 SS5]